MSDEQFDKLAGWNDALFRTLAILVRNLHARSLIDAPDLVREIRMLAGTLDSVDPRLNACIAGMARIATVFEDAQPDWAEARTVRELFRPEKAPD